MRAHPSALPTIREQGALFGEIIADLVSDGKPITEILTQILSYGPISLREAVHVARFMQPGVDRLHKATPLGPCQVCGGPSHEYYSPDQPSQPSRF